MLEDRTTSHSVVSSSSDSTNYRGEKPPEISAEMERDYPNLSMAQIGRRLRYLEARQEGIDSALMLLLKLDDKTAFNLVQIRLGTPTRAEARQLEERARAIWSRECGLPASKAPDMKRFGDIR